MPSKCIKPNQTKPNQTEILYDVLMFGSSTACVNLHSMDYGSEVEHSEPKANGENAEQMQR